MMSTKAQNILIQYLLKPLAKPFMCLKETHLQGLTFFCLLGILLLNFAYHGLTTLRYLFFFVPSCVLLGIVILCGVTKNMRPVRWNLALFLPWCGVAVLTCTAALLYNIEAMADGALFLVAFPVFWMVWGQRDCQILFASIVRAIKWSFWLLLPVLIIFYPVGTAGYQAFFGNPNSLAMYFTLVFCAFLFDCFTIVKMNVKAIINYVSIGLCAALLFYTASRGGEYTCIIALVLTAVLLLVVFRKQFIRCLLYAILPTLIAVAIFIPTTLHMVYTSHEFITSIPAVLADVVSGKPTIPTTEPVTVPTTEPVTIPTTEPVTVPTTEPVTVPTTEPVTVPTTEPVTVPTTEPVTVPTTEPVTVPTTEPVTVPTTEPVTVPTTEPVVPDFDAIRDTNTNKLIASFFENIDIATSGRRELWSIYLRELNLFGNGKETLYADDGSEVTLSPHLTVLAVAYNSGIIAGICYLVFNLATGICAILYALRHRESIYGLLPFLFTVTFGALSLIETIGGPFINMITLVYYLVQTPMMVKEGINESVK